MLDEIIISKAITESFMKDFLEAMEVDVAIGGAGPLAGLHVDPLAMRAKLVIDATGHAGEICHIVANKLGGKLRTKAGKVVGEKSLWAEMGEKVIIDNTREVYPGLIVAGMAANAVFGAPRMGPIFGGMLLSGNQAAEVATDILQKVKGS